TISARTHRSSTRYHPSVYWRAADGNPADRALTRQTAPATPGRRGPPATSRHRRSNAGNTCEKFRPGNRPKLQGRAVPTRRTLLVESEPESDRQEIPESPPALEGLREWSARRRPPPASKRNHRH